MFNCPSCSNLAVKERLICLCGAELTLLHQLDEIADVWFNRAVEALENGAPGRAIEWLSACCAARPTDASARLAQAQVWLQLGFPAQALDALDRAAQLEPDAPELEQLRAACQPAPAVKAPAPRAKKRRKKTARR